MNYSPTKIHANEHIWEHWQKIENQAATQYSCNSAEVYKTKQKYIAADSQLESYKSLLLSQENVHCVSFL